MGRQLSGALAVGVAAVLAAGCEAPPPPRPAMSTMHLREVSPGAALATTRAVLEEYDFRIEMEDGQRGYLRTLPQAEVIEGGTNRISDPVLKGRNLVRRIAEAYVEEKGGEATVRLSVVRERLDTSARRAFIREREDRDFPQDTPIEQEAGSTTEQYESWTPLGRDRSLENSIRASIEERLARR